MFLILSSPVDAFCGHRNDKRALMDLDLDSVDLTLSSCGRMTDTNNNWFSISMK